MVIIMDVKVKKSYTITLNDEEVNQIIHGISLVYAAAAKDNTVEKLDYTYLWTFKDVLVAAKND